MKQEERRRQTINLLLDTVKELIAEKGCNATTMQDIMQRSGLSKGAIFHYVKSKNELFVLVLQGRLEQTNRRFMQEIEQNRRTFAEPMAKIKESIVAYANPQDVTNKVLLYLLGNQEDPLVAEALESFYEHSLQLAMKWIRLGQEHGVISSAIDARNTAELFTMLTFGMRIRASLAGLTSADGESTANDLASFMESILNP